MKLYRLHRDTITDVVSINVDSDQEATELLYKDVKIRSPDFHSYYLRGNLFPDGSILYDYGSHSWFYLFTDRNFKVNEIVKGL